MGRVRHPPPPPVETRETVGTAVITAAWSVALVVLLILRGRLAPDQRWWIWVAVAGVLLGLFGLWYVPRLKAVRARSAGPEEPPPPAGPGG